jgi:hypothetical protein
MRTDTSARVHRSLSESSRRKARAAEEKREATASGKALHATYADEFRQSAAVAKQFAVESRAAAARAKAVMARQKQIEVAISRDHILLTD